jgi:hypothetical protein
VWDLNLSSFYSEAVQFGQVYPVSLESAGLLRILYWTSWVQEPWGDLKEEARFLRNLVQE